MSPENTRRLRRSTALIAVLWALSALVLAVYGQFAVPRYVDPPLQTTAIGGLAVINTRSAEAREAGIRLGDRLLSVDERPIQEWYRGRGWEELVAGAPNRYRIQGSGGEIREVDLTPRPRSSPYQSFFLPIFAALALVGTAYLTLGVLVFRLRPERAESWAFLLFSSAMATALFLGVHTYDAPFGHQRMLMNLPLIGATIFHLFTTFPSEPPWVTRHRRIQTRPYAVAVAIAAATLLDVGVASGRLAYASFACAFLGAAIAIGVLLRERFRIRGSAHAESADLVLIGVLVSFAPVMLALAAMLFTPISVPMSLTMVWFVGFPVAVAYGIVRGQLFDIRGIARSSVAYGAATLAITGFFALMITSADAAFRRFNVNAQSPYFSVTFLFFAILAFNPLRNRLQTLVDRLFDRDRAGYRTAVREISEAM
ncbi:MAG TPA: hypothetical protein VML54_11250, partial [Candidatus Limnocylindrales bacterium]|nr:hypothetical protein [Candidatus Limnocylindrales bacterium]